MIKIHHFGPTRSQRVVWLCEEMGLPYEIVKAEFPTRAEYRAINPIGSLPFLEDDGDVAINESVAIMLYLATRYGPTDLLPGPADPCYPTVMQLTVFGEATAGALLNVILGARFRAPDPEKNNWSVRSAAERLKTAADFITGKLGERPYLAGDRFTLADISTGYAVGVLRGPVADLVPLPAALLTYHDRLVERPAYQRSAGK